MDTATTRHPLCRLARPEDDLSLVLGAMNGDYLNREQVLVAEWHGQVVGMLVLWDGGHSVVMVDHFIVSPTAPTDTGAQLIFALNQYAKERQKVSLVFVTPSVELTYQAKRRGAIVLGPMYRVTYPISDQKGAHHA